MVGGKVKKSYFMDRNCFMILQSIRTGFLNTKLISDKITLDKPLIDKFCKEYAKARLIGRKKGSYSKNYVYYNITKDGNKVIALYREWNWNEQHRNKIFEDYKKLRLK